MSRHGPPTPGNPQAAMAQRLAGIEQQLAQLAARRVGGVISWGFMDSGTEVKAGTGDFTVTKPSEGEYKVTWDTPKGTANYAVVVSPEQSAFICAMETLSITAASFVARAYVVGGTSKSTDWCFVAISTS